jgi:hypothetical protein
VVFMNSALYQVIIAWASCAESAIYFSIESLCCMTILVVECQVLDR